MRVILTVLLLFHIRSDSAVDMWPNKVRKYTFFFFNTLLLSWIVNNFEKYILRLCLIRKIFPLFIFHSFIPEISLSLFWRKFIIYIYDYINCNIWFSDIPVNYATSIWYCHCTQCVYNSSAASYQSIKGEFVSYKLMIFILHLSKIVLQKVCIHSLGFDWLLDIKWKI